MQKPVARKTYSVQKAVERINHGETRIMVLGKTKFANCFPEPKAVEQPPDYTEIDMNRSVIYERILAK